MAAATFFVFCGWSGVGAAHAQRGLFNAPSSATAMLDAIRNSRRRNLIEILFIVILAFRLVCSLKGKRTTIIG